MTNPPPPPPPGNYPPPPPPPGGGYPPPPPGGGYNPPPPPPGGGYNPPPPPPPGGGYNPPPPPPPGGGYPPPPQGGYAPPPVGGQQALPPEAYTPWGSRALAGLIDFALPLALGIGIGWGILLGTQECIDLNETFGGDYGDLGGGFSGQVCGASTFGQISVVVFPLLAILFILWNSGIKQGNSGQSIGKGIMKFKVVDEATGQPVGAGKSLLRELVYLVAYFVCGIVWLVAILFPLWDPKRQTLIDKLFTTIALPV
jgi:uncharacterized RDD family membrane protein YckC